MPEMPEKNPMEISNYIHLRFDKMKQVQAWALWIQRKFYMGDTPPPFTREGGTLRNKADPDIPGQSFMAHPLLKDNPRFSGLPPEKNPVPDSNPNTLEEAEKREDELSMDLKPKIAMHKQPNFNPNPSPFGS